ncbi:NAD-dependent epimerase/dehydratase family protein, partial [Gemmatimonadota bacterium]
MRVVVTGGAGFLGSHVCDHLLGKGHTIVCLDNLITGSLDNVAHLDHNGAFTLARHDVSRYISVDGPVDAVLHF